MPATTGIQLTVWEIGLWAVLLTCAVSFTVNTVRKAVIHAAPDGGRLALQAPLGQRDREPVKEPDATFWNIFAGLVVIVPAVVIPALARPPSGS
ncbi:hypothetical protein AHiyo8_34180 [Arthrobacter sp. Hiyo8]|nr:hypothetical protein AHiyo8_34180 [Arthrobacter sp. Hiyo8]